MSENLFSYAELESSKEVVVKSADNQKVNDSQILNRQNFTFINESECLKLVLDLLDKE